LTVLVSLRFIPSASRSRPLDSWAGRASAAAEYWVLRLQGSNSQRSRPNQVRARRSCKDQSLRSKYAVTVRTILLPVQVADKAQLEPIVVALRSFLNQSLESLQRYVTQTAVSRQSTAGRTSRTAGTLEAVLPSPALTCRCGLVERRDRSDSHLRTRQIAGGSGQNAVGATASKPARSGSRPAGPRQCPV